MERLKIAISQIGKNETTDNLVRQICDNPAMLELCTPTVYEKEEAALRDLEEGKMDALVYVPTAEPKKCPNDATEIVATDKTIFMPLTKEPTAEDIARFRNILERDFDFRSPRVAIVQEASVQNPDLASQVTAEQGTNTYGPYTTEQFLAEDRACHFDGIVTAEGDAAVERIIKELLLEAPVRYFAGRVSVVTAVYQPVSINNTEEGLADVSALTRPFYVATDIIRNRVFYDEARQNPLPKLFRDRREDREKGEKMKVEKVKGENDGQ